MRIGWSAAIRFVTFFLLVATCWADGLKDNLPVNVRRIPKLGIEVPAEQKAQLTAKLEALWTAIEQLRAKPSPQVQRLLPDVLIYHQAVSDALRYQEFFAPREIPVAMALLEEGRQRAVDLAKGQAPWTTATGLVVRGYVSRIDGSVQPYGLVVPESYTPAGKQRYRLDIWFHGRGETLSQVNFIQGRRRSRGQFAPADTIVLHPYGRYCNAFKFAGEVDVLEALASTQTNYRIDEDRVAVRGFSMGGAGCWQMATHFADRWFAANPGAGFAETAEFLRVFQKEDLKPTWWEKKLWHMYDCTDYAVNLMQCPTVAYSGEIDIQKQAADIMARALAREGVTLTHIIGPKTKHRYHPDSAAEVERRMDRIAELGRERLPRHVRLVTYTLKYNRMNWITIDGLGEHWERASVAADISADNEAVTVKTENVTDLSLDMNSGWAPFAVNAPVRVVIDGVPLSCPSPESDRSWRVRLHHDGGQWTVGPRTGGALRKRHDLQGPIDDAFMESFMFVRPTGQASHDGPGEWSNHELDRAIEQWRRQFRGHARVKNDDEITDADIAAHHLVLWGDPSSNAVMKRIADRLPIRWTAEAIVVGQKRFNADQHALIMIYPNPLNPDRYVVINSSFTYREFAYLNNARQVPMLPDWAVIDLRTPANSVWPGQVVEAGFFDEQWQLIEK